MKECFLMVGTVLFNWQCLITLITPENKICIVWNSALVLGLRHLQIIRQASVNQKRWQVVMHRSSGHNRHWQLTNLIGLNQKLRKVGTIKASTTTEIMKKKILTGIIWKNLKYIHLILRGNLTLFWNPEKQRTHGHVSYKICKQSLQSTHKIFMLVWI